MSTLGPILLTATIAGGILCLGLLAGHYGRVLAAWLDGHRRDRWAEITDCHCDGCTELRAAMLRHPSRRGRV